MVTWIKMILEEYCKIEEFGMLVKIKSIDCETEICSKCHKEIAYLKGVWVIGMLDPETSIHNLVRLYLVCNLALACLYVLKYIRNMPLTVVREE